MMKNILILSCIFLQSIKANAQTNLSVDNEKAFSVTFLAVLSTADLSTLDTQLTSKGYKIVNTDLERDYISYSYNHYNYFLIRRQLKTKLIDIQLRYVDVIYEKYKSELLKLGLTLQKSSMTEKGIELLYYNDKWYASLQKNMDNVTKENSIYLMIGPAMP